MNDYWDIICRMDGNDVMATYGDSSTAKTLLTNDDSFQPLVLGEDEGRCWISGPNQ